VSARLDGPVFLSHASPDKPFVRRLRSSLATSKFETWVDEHDLLPGDDLPGEIARALAGAAVFVVVISANSVGSRWLTYELRLATQRMVEGELLVVPLRLDDSEAPPEIRSLLWADFRGDFDIGWRVLLAALERRVHRGTDRRPNLLATVEHEPWLDAGEMARLKIVLGEHVAEALRTMRVLEARTGHRNGLATTQLLEVLAHLATFAGRDELGEDERAAQLKAADDHCRRALIDGSEVIVRSRVAELAAMWEEYAEVTQSPSPDLEALRSAISQRIDAARTLQLSPRWEDARTLAGEWHAIATLLEQLTDGVQAHLAQTRGCRSPQDRAPERSWRQRVRWHSRR
jgi:hypothetical protein